MWHNIIARDESGTILHVWSWKVPGSLTRRKVKKWARVCCPTARLEFVKGDLCASPDRDDPCPPS